MSIEALRQRSRRVLHDKMGRPAVYYPTPKVNGSEGEPEGQDITARKNLKVGQTGDLAGTNLSYVENRDMDETLTLWTEQVPEPRRNSLVIFSATEGYFIDAVDPVYDQTISCIVLRAPQSDLNGLRDPDGEVIAV